MNLKVKHAPGVFFAFIALVSAALAAYFYADLLALRREGLGKDDSAALRKKLWDTERRLHDLEAELARLRSKGFEIAQAENSAEKKPGNSDGGDNRRGNRGDMRANWQKLQENPEYQKLQAIQQKAALDRSYAQLFKSLNLTPQQLDKFKGLLVEKQMAVNDVIAAVRAEGLNPRDPNSRTQIGQLLSQSNADLDNSIRATLGDQAFATYKNYEQTVPQRNDVSQLAQRLSYTNSPLQDYQSEQLVQILAANSPQRSTNNTGAPDNLANIRNPDRPAPITDGALNQAAQVLTPTQVAALADLKAEQAAQQKLNSLVRGGGAPPSAPAGGSAPVPRPGG